jgi:hypothetical protein
MLTLGYWQQKPPCQEVGSDPATQGTPNILRNIPRNISRTLYFICQFASDTESEASKIRDTREK